MNKDTSRDHIHFLRPVPLALLLDDYAGRIVRELWRTNQEFSPVDIIKLRFFMLIHHVEDEQ
jgi:hypothetical protein